MNGPRRRPHLPLKFPRDCVVFLGGTDSEERNYLLWKNGKTFCVQTPAFWSPKDMWSYACYSDEKRRLQAAEDWQAVLRTIHSLLNTIEFGKTNWGYLVTGKDGIQHILQKQKHMRRMVCNTWAPVITEREIEYTKISQDANDRAGFWRGRPVDVYVGYDNCTIRIAELHTRAYWRARSYDMDLTYELLAHIADDDGNLIGYAVEADLGRLPQYRDKALVYEAFARLQQRGIVYRSAIMHCVTIYRGKVRLSNIAAMVVYDDPEKFEKDVKKYHWDNLEIFFLQMDPNDFTPRPPCTQVLHTPLLYMSVYPTPERPLFVSFCVIMDSTWFPHDFSEDRKPKSRRRLLTGPSGKYISLKANRAREVAVSRQIYRAYTGPQEETSSSRILPETFTDVCGDTYEDISSPQTMEYHNKEVVEDDPRKHVWNKPFMIWKLKLINAGAEKHFRQTFPNLFYQ